MKIITINDQEIINMRKLKRAFVPVKRAFVWEGGLVALTALITMAVLQLIKIIFF